MFDYDPREASFCLPEGDYQAVIKGSEEAVSKTSGAPMLTVFFEVYHSEGTMQLRDYIVRPKTIFKLKQIAAALGRAKEFEEKRFNIEEHHSESITLSLGVRNSAEYGDQNTVAAYLPYERPAAVAAGTANTSMNNNARRTAPSITKDDIPF